MNKADSTTLETDQALGARGTDRVSLTNSSGTFISYPLYDAHGNEVATLAKSGSSYTTGHARSYGAWGEVRQGDTTGGPRARYCGNLGHVQDDETGLIYMRARYYDVSSGRFISEDLDRRGTDLFLYTRNNPVDFGDASGKAGEGIQEMLKALGEIGGNFLEILDYAGSLWDACNLASMDIALRIFFGDLAEAKTSLDVEADWDEFMERWDDPKDPTDGYLDLGFGIIGYVLNYAEGNVGGLCLMGGIEVMKLAVLAMAYQARIAWYIADIDSD